MARKNMFEGITPATAAKGQQPTAKMPEVFQSSGPVAAMRNDLRSVGARSVQEIDPAMIEDGGMKDRLGDLNEDIAELRESIARHGQQVPILLRPHPALSGRYQVVYGRRRLAAIRGLGQPVKALIRSLSDEEAILAQGQENNLRKDPSFIEKTLFAGDLEEAGYEARVIQDALNVSRSHTSHMRKVREAIPRSVIERIGAAPSVGWKRWYDLASRLQEHAINAEAIHTEAFPEASTSDQRFDLWLGRFEQAIEKPEVAEKAPALQLATENGSPIGTLNYTAGKVVFRSDAKAKAFAQWLTANAEDAFRRLHHEFLDQSKKG